MTKREEQIQIANEILRQLGGNHFTVMTGAKSFIALEFGLSFQLPNARQAKGVKYVRVELCPSDTYVMTFLNQKGADISIVSGLYCDQIRQTFETATGLYTSMGTMGAR